jgi:RNA polymerase sigma-70 factor (ECF subfamily)
MIGNDATVEDLCQTAFMRMVSGLAALKSPESFESWLMRLARNVCVDHLRRERLRRLFVPFSREHEQVAEQPATPEEARLASLRRAVLGLPVRQRELVALLQEQELSYEELARITRSTVSSVKSRLFRAREELKRRTRDES